MKIDIGAGTRPQKGYDVYTDIYKSDVVKNNVEIASRFTLAAMEDMRAFKDKEFEFAYCHHVIEHVNDPDKACKELIRIAESGILYFPTTEAEILFGRSDHNWMVFQPKNNHLLFVRKRFQSYYSPKTLPAGVRQYTALQQKPFEWKGEFTWTVVQ